MVHILVKILILGALHQEVVVMTLLIVHLNKNKNVKNISAASLVLVVKTNGAHHNIVGNNLLGIGTQLLLKPLLKKLLLMITYNLTVVLLQKNV